MPADEIEESLLDWFWELHLGRTMGPERPNRLTWESIGWWGIATGTNPEPWQISALMEMDTVYMDHLSGKTDDRGRDISTQPLTPALFRALFVSGR